MSRWLEGVRGLVRAEELEAIEKQAERQAPEEACGVLLYRGGQPGVRWLIRCMNAGEGPERGFRVGVGDLKRIAGEMGRGWRMGWVWHSHVEGSPRLSEADVRHVGQHYPGLPQVVVAVVGGRVSGVGAWVVEQDGAVRAWAPPSA